MWTHNLIAQVEREKDSLPLHESGHACALIICGRRFEYLTIEPAGPYKEKYKGFVYGVEQRGDLDDAVVSYAGICAEKIKFGSWPYADQGGQVDRDHANEVITRLHGPYASSVIHRQVMEKAERLLRLNWEKVCRVAKELEQKRFLSYNEVKELFK